MKTLRGYSMEKVKALEKEGKAVRHTNGVAWIVEGDVVLVCTYDSGLGVYTKCFKTDNLDPGDVAAVADFFQRFPNANK